MGMDQYLLIPFLGEWTSIYQLFWCSPGVQGFDTLPDVPRCSWVLRHIPGSCRGKWRSPGHQVKNAGAFQVDPEDGASGHGGHDGGKLHGILYIYYIYIYIYYTYIYNYIWYVYRYIDTGWWFGTFFFNILGIIIPTDELIFFRVVGIPPTRYISK